MTPRRHLAFMFFRTVLCCILILTLVCVNLDPIGSWRASRLRWCPLKKLDHQKRGAFSPSCRPRQTIAFLKTHKCASSSVQNLLMRYGDRENLTFALPAHGNYLGHPGFFNRSMTTANTGRYFDMLVHHARLQEAEIRAVLGPKAAFVTIMRDPVTAFESLFSYYNFERRLGMSLEALLTAWDGEDLGSIVTLLRRLTAGDREKLGMNQMAFDLGLEEQTFFNRSAVKDFVRGLDKTFDIVMIAERMLESLVLLRDLLCWNVDDVVVFKHNARSDIHRVPLGHDQAIKLKKLNAADVYLYKYFSRRLDERITAYGRDKMAFETLRLAIRTQELYECCVQKVSGKPGGLGRPFQNAPQVALLEGYTDGPEECRRLLLQELVYTEELRQKQDHQMHTVPGPPTSA